MRTIRTAALATAAGAALVFGVAALAQETQKPAPRAEQKADRHQHGDKHQGGHGCGGMWGGQQGDRNHS